MKESVIKWQTGEPKETDTYLVSVRTLTSREFITTDYYYLLKGKWQYWDKEVIAWCKLSDIEPYKEEDL